MNKVIAFAVTATLLAFGTAALGQESLTTQSVRRVAPKGISAALYACIDKAGFDQARMGSCIQIEKKLQDARLNQVYGKLIAKLDGKTRDSVRAAERAWLDFNTKSVVAETDIGGANQVAGFDVAEAELFRYCERANVLERYLSSIGE